MMRMHTNMCTQRFVHASAWERKSNRHQRGMPVRDGGCNEVHAKWGVAGGGGGTQRQHAIPHAWGTCVGIMASFHGALRMFSSPLSV